jgi:hypothetical protein
MHAGKLAHMQLCFSENKPKCLHVYLHEPPESTLGKNHVGVGRTLYFKFKYLGLSKAILKMA